ncbi:MAG: hypothetical protein AAFV53_21625 [Myxococcota bacterium]
MLGGLQRQKLQRLFTLVDIDQSGAVEYTDLEAVMKRTLEAANQAEDSVIAEGAEAMLRHFWRNFKDIADINRDDKVDHTEWFSCWEAQLDAEMDVLFTDLPPIIRQVQLLIAQALGVTDHKGADIDAYRRFLAPYGAPIQATAEQTFAQLDLDGNGVISSDELQQLTAEFFIADEDAPGNLLFGTLDRDAG